MTRSDGILVIGGGLIGLSTAWQVAKHRADVTVVDAAARVGDGASRANGGMVTPALSEPWNGPGAVRQFVGALAGAGGSMRIRWHALPSLVGFGLRYLRHSAPAPVARALVASHAVARYTAAEMRVAAGDVDLSDTWWPTGTLAVYRDAAELETQRRRCAALGAGGPAVVELTAAEVLAREPALGIPRGEIAGGLWFPDDQAADSGRLCERLAQDFERRGGVVRLGRRVVGLAPSGDGWEVRFDDGTFARAQHVVVAAGAYSAPLVRPLGIRLPVRPAKGCSLTIDLQGQRVPVAPVYDQGSHLVLTPLGNRLRVAGTADFCGYDRTIPPATAHRLLSTARRVFPGLSLPVEIRDANPWVGLRPVSADGLPYIGACGPSGLWLNTGHGALGLTHALGSGGLIASLLCGSATAIAADPYSPARRLG